MSIQQITPASIRPYSLAVNQIWFARIEEPVGVPNKENEYQFRLVNKGFFDPKDGGPMRPFWLGVKQGVDIDPAGGSRKCWWFDQNGCAMDDPRGGFRFVLTYRGDESFHSEDDKTVACGFKLYLVEKEVLSIDANLQDGIVVLDTGLANTMDDELMPVLQACLAS